MWKILKNSIRFASGGSHVALFVLASLCFCSQACAAGPVPLSAQETAPQIVCTPRVLEVYRSDNQTDELQINAFNLKEDFYTERNNLDHVSDEKDLVEYLASIYNTSDQITKDAIALYFTETSGCRMDELAGDNDKAKEEAMDFIKKCLADEEEQALFPVE
jgi:hypothetical protein